MKLKLVAVEEILSLNDLKITLQKHNAFPDCVIFNNNTYLAFRSAAHHQPAKNSMIVVIKSPNQRDWDLERVLKINNLDLRDPKFCVFNNSLNLYFGAVKPIKYGKHPVGIFHTRLLKNNRWSNISQVYKNEYLPSRIRLINNLIFMCVYKWSTKNPFFSESRIITSLDGKKWIEKTPYGHLIQEGTEADCILTNERNLLWIIRKDFSKKQEFGSNIYLISPTKKVIKIINDKRKFDAPLLFKIRAQLFLIARSHKLFKGKYDFLSFSISKIIKNILNPVTYWFSEKGTSIWRIDETSLTISKQIDIPSHGDTGYCSIIKPPISPFFYIYNYSSSLNSRSIHWRKGQNLPTTIYRYSLKITK